MMVILAKYLFIMIFLSSAIGKIVGFDDMLIYFAGLTKNSFPLLRSFLWILIIFELLISLLVWMNNLRSKSIYILTQGLLITFLATNILFLSQGVENCGCFGVSVQSHPIISILKTIFLIMNAYYLRNGKFFPIGLKIEKRR